ncbi:MAG: tripartite tricarboxylate transporter TctB family protein, partial [Geminicoccaceae bacterium]|nr:tripartite tricarboxylate transporter TctB family protein [Geminicoccaceae bacterium]
MTPALARADLIAGLAFVALGLGALALSLDMPRFEERNINPYTVPGLVPGALGLIIALLGALLALRSLGGVGPTTSPAADAAGPPAVRRVGLTLLLTLGYAAGLVGRMPFWLATFLFVLAFVVAFQWRAEAERRVRRIAFALLYAALLSAAITYVFQ